MKKIKGLKRILCLVLCAMMVLGLATPTFANTKIEKGKVYTRIGGKSMKQDHGFRCILHIKTSGVLVAKFYVKDRVSFTMGISTLSPNYRNEEMHDSSDSGAMYESEVPLEEGKHYTKTFNEDSRCAVTRMNVSAGQIIRLESSFYFGHDKVFGVIKGTKGASFTIDQYDEESFSDYFYGDGNRDYKDDYTVVANPKTKVPPMAGDEKIYSDLTVCYKKKSAECFACIHVESSGVITFEMENCYLSNYNLDYDGRITCFGDKNRYDRKHNVCSIEISEEDVGEFGCDIEFDIRSKKHILVKNMKIRIKGEDGATFSLPYSNYHDAIPYWF